VRAQHEVGQHGARCCQARAELSRRCRQAQLQRKLGVLLLLLLMLVLLCRFCLLGVCSQAGLVREACCRCGAVAAAAVGAAATC
jgi:hypothetical protein